MVNMKIHSYFVIVLFCFSCSGFYFYIISDLYKSYKSDTENVHVPFTRIPQMLNFTVFALSFILSFNFSLL